MMPGQEDRPSSEPKPDREAGHGHTDETVDEASDESFPASDPPAFTHSHAGPPKHGEGAAGGERGE